jgi:type VI protein secretion system component VasF
MKSMPSPSEAERNQRRKLAFVPMWPIIGVIVVLGVLFFLAR